MFNFVLTTMLVLGVVFGSGATTVALAQVTQPDQLLYPVKTWSEEVRIGWETDAQEELGLALQFTDRRVEEIRTLLETGEVVPETVLNRYGNQEQQVLGIAAGMPDDLAIPAFERVLDQVRLQAHTMTQLQLSEPSAVRTRARVITMLQTQARLAQAGIENPEALREQLHLRERIQIKLGTPPEVLTSSTEVTPSDSNSSTTGIPTSDSSYGPGTSQYPWTETTPEPGSGYGPESGTGDCPMCTNQPGNGGSWRQPGSGNGGAKGP